MNDEDDNNSELEERRWERERDRVYGPADYPRRDRDLSDNHSGSKIVYGWAITAALGILAMFTWNLTETMALKTTVSTEFGKLNVKLEERDKQDIRRDRELDTTKEMVADLRARMAEIEKRRDR